MGSGMRRMWKIRADMWRFWEEIESEFDLLGEYMDMYVQLLPYCVVCGGLRIHMEQLPTFEYFKESYNDSRYSLVVPHYKESKTVYDKCRIGSVHAHGMCAEEGIGYRYYNYWMGCKYFTGGNISGDYIVKTGEINEVLKRL